MAILPLLEVAVRRFYPSGISGSALWVQHLGLWLGFLGAAIAARRGELLSLTLPGERSALRTIFVAGVGFAVCLVLTHGSLDLVAVEREGGRELALGIPVWVALTVMPVGFALIACRLVWRAAPAWPGRLAAMSFGIVPVALRWAGGLQESSLYIPLALAILAATALGAPIFVGLGGIAAVLLWHDLFPVSAIPTEAYNMAVKPILPTIPLFTLAGFILAEGGTPRRLVELFRALVGSLPGGVAIVAIVVCSFFTSFTGGSGVTILAMGGLLFPMLLAEGYRPKFSTGLLTSAGSLGLLFPPSLAVILYGLVAEIELRHLFLSGFLPGMLEMGLVALLAFGAARESAVARVRFDGRSAIAAVWKAKWELLIPLLVLGSIVFGFATLVEAAALTVLYAFLLEFVIHRELGLRKDLLRVGGDAAAVIGGVLIILGVALGLTNFLVFAEIPQQGVEWVQSLVSSPLLFLLILNLFLLVVGCTMDIYSAIVVVVPLVAPLGAFYGIDPFHLGIIFLTNLELGYLTPPVGMNLFLASYRFRQPLPEVYRAAFPFLLVRCVGVALVTYVPFLTSVLPSLLSE
ncbi:MAG TPA: TRAP transporter large permease subunit [Vicinamibacteria bacterium]|nr:TRAP transporter large permease subunit [Vicinamibacteria bacterium]